MSSSKVKKVKVRIPFTATWLADVLTVTTSSVHNLVTGDVVSIPCAGGYESTLVGAVTVTNTTVFTIAAVGTPFEYLNGIVVIDFIRSISNAIVAAPTSAGVAGLVQASVTGTNGSTTVVYGSCDGVKFTTTAIGTLTCTTGQTQFLSIPNNWPFLKLDTTAIGASTKLELWYAA
jgi:hypothetical protein